ncbi:D-alanyl-D-alanine carboxypeptidase family protein [Anaeroselena agilis]|uniref:serine-type D-Ala-D-Ala carboxypeptidase n=1 Tax=Anaeroselena agilis TaxID=3063788 RepID=A0ABU3P236_9FIRM|nr:D-alanyl-D-alanine carboxypeptidase family protein [Selenomonadales bacterium 4137-cl]
MAWQRITLTLMAVFIGICLVLPAAAAAPPQIKARAGVLIDAKTGEVLFEKNSRDRNAPASTTKIMTAILAIENGRLDDPVRVSLRAAATRGSSMHLYSGQILSLRELITGLLMRSGNDAAVAIAEHLDGSSDAFVARMNERARTLGATDTHFRNPHGLSAPGHYSSAYDLALLARYALADPTFAAIVGSKEISIEWLDRRGREKDINLRNTNKLLWMLEEADGVKTGTTGEAGPCLVSSATRGNHKLIAVVLHDHSRWYDSMQLLKYGFDNYDLYDYADQGALIATLPVERGLAATVDAVAAGPAALVVPTADYSRVTVEVDLPKTIRAPVYRGQKIGEVVFFVDDKAKKTVDLVANCEVSERTLVKTFLRGLLHTFRLLAGWGVL